MFGAQQGLAVNNEPLPRHFEPGVGQDGAQVESPCVEPGTVDVRNKPQFSAPRTTTYAERRSAEQVWLRQTTLRQRREVIKYLKSGHVHPDPDLAARAYRWAKGETEFNIFRNAGAGLRTVLATCWLPGLSRAVFNLRLARHIVEVSQRHVASSQQPPAAPLPDAANPD